MKTIALTLFLVLYVAAQAPQNFNYQGVLQNSEGQVLKPGGGMASPRARLGLILRGHSKGRGSNV